MVRLQVVLKGTLGVSNEFYKTNFQDNHYTDMLNTNKWRRVIVKQDGAPPHRSLEVRDTIKNRYLNGSIDRDSDPDAEKSSS